MSKHLNISMKGPEMRTVQHHADGDNADIINTIHLSLPKATKLVKDVAHSFVGFSIKETAKNIFDFLMENVRYKMDGYHQKIKMPNRLIADGTGDCKSYALFAASVLNSLGITFKFRYTAYDGTSVPQHVYVVAMDGSQEIIIDPVYKKFNSEAPYTYKRDYDMKISTIHGVKLYDNFHPVAKNNFIGRTNPLAIVPFAPARGAFLLLVKFNVRAFATNLDKARKTDYQKIASKWELLGGNWEQLDKTIVEGAKRKMIFGHDGKLGFPGAEILAAIAAAAPIIAAIIPLVKQILGNKETTKENAPVDQVDLSLTETKQDNAIVPMALLSSLFLFR